ncbi:MAG: membrane protein insertion efficiency factor YidD [Chloroflexi bacterium]|nr:membrane protein insertion efficiency factor YidD [Chloroflexota bacterium]
MAGNSMKRLLITFLRLYKRAVSPYWPGVCRYHPSCSEYAQDAIETHGAVRGALLAAGRLARCGPWGTGGYDPVPRSDHSRA